MEFETENAVESHIEWVPKNEQKKKKKKKTSTKCDIKFSVQRSRHIDTVSMSVLVTLFS